MKKYIPRFIKLPLIGIYIWLRTALRGRADSKIVLNLSGVIPPKGSSKIIHGGKVKLLALRERFGDSWKHFNIAYFVSSGLPFAPNLWIKIYKFFGIKIVWNQNGTAYPALYPEKNVRRVNGLMSPIHLADYVIYQTEFTKHSADKFLGKYKGALSVLINPVDTKHFKPKENVNDKFTILMSGHHFESVERMEVSIGAVRKIRESGIDAKLLVIGKTENCPKETWTEEVGSYTQEEAPSLYQRAHMLLHLKYLDPCPTIVLEALASGLPVVGQKNGGMPELVDEKSGVLIPVVEDFNNLHYPSIDEVVEAISYVKENLDNFSQTARQSAVEMFDKKIWLKKHEEIFNKLLK